MTHRKILTLAELLDELENNEDVDIPDVYIEPPDVAECTDQDSASEDEGGYVENLSGRQLRAPAELRVTSSEQAVRQEDELTDTPGPSNKRRKTSNHTWKKQCDLPSQLPFTFPSSLSYDYTCMQCPDIFELFFGDDVCTLLVNESTKYACFLNLPDPKITCQELKCFLAILVVSGYNKLPSKKSYWDGGDDMRNTLVYNAMRRDRFIQIMRFMHAADNTSLDASDKMTKLRPLMILLKKKFLHHLPKTQHFNYDESMIEYFGRHGCKQCIRNKPIRFGYKCWCLNSSNGYLANFEIYQGCIPGANIHHEKEFGKATAPLLSMIDDLPEAIKNQKLEFYFDNLFTGLPLLLHLKSMGYGGTGTLRQNRLEKECPIAKVEVMKKKDRGTFEYACQGDIIVVRWMDNSVVTVASTCYGVNPLGSADRYSKARKQKVKVPRPNLIGVYNKYMGGTDLMDSHVNNYRIGIRGKKWWWPIFTWLIDVAINNSWILMRMSGKNITQLDFRREIARTYLTKYGTVPKIGGRPPLPDKRVLPGVRYDGVNHFPKQVEKKRRCAGEGCNTIGRVICSKCSIGLCLKCFEIYHL